MLGILLLAAHLRPALTGLTPLIGQIRVDTGISYGVAGLLTALPLLAMGVLSPIAPLLARRLGIERVLLASMLVLAAGILLRSAGAAAALFLGTAVLGRGSRPARLPGCGASRHRLARIFGPVGPPRISGRRGLVSPGPGRSRDERLPAASQGVAARGARRSPGR